MSKKFLSAILFGALMVTSTGTFVSCKNYDDDIDNLQDQINTVVKDLADLKAQIGDKGVTSVTYDEATGVLTVVTGGDSKTYTIKSSAAGVQNIVMDGNSLVVDGKTIGEFKPGDTVTVSDAGELMINGKETGIFTGRSAIITDKTAQTITIKMPDANGEMEEVVLPIYNPASSIASLEFISTTNAAVNKNYTIHWGQATAALAWEGPKGAIAKDQLLVGNINDLYVQVMPANADLSVSTITLAGSDGTVAPVSVMAVPYEGAITVSAATRAASANGVWTLNIKPDATVNAGNIAKAFQTSDGADYGYALNVGGNILSGYNTMIAVNATSANNLNADGITYGGNALSTPVPFGKSITFDFDGTEAYDAYLTAVSPADLELAGVAINGKTMTISSTEAAAGKTVKFNVVSVGYDGVQAAPFQINVTFEGSSVTPDTPVATVDYTVTEAVKPVMMNAGTTFTGLTAAQAEALVAATPAWNVVSIDGKAVAAADQSTANGRFVFGLASVKYYQDLNADGTGKTEVTLATADGIRSIKYIGFSGADYQAAAKPGSYLLNLTFTQGANQLKKIAGTVNVTLPAFNQLFTKVTSAWNSNQTVLNALLNSTTAPMVYVMTNALNVVNNSGADWAYLSLAPAKMKINNVDTEVAAYANPDLSMEAALLDNGAVRGNVAVEGEYRVKGKEGLAVEMAAFDVNFYSPFQNAMFKFYNEGAVAAGKVEVAIDGSGTGVIAAYNVPSGGKANGLQLQVLNDAQPVSTSLNFFGVTIDKYELAITGAAIPTTAKAELTAGGISLTGMNTGVYDANVVVTVTALNAIKTVLTLPIVTK